MTQSLEALSKALQEARERVPAGSYWTHRKGGRYLVRGVSIMESNLIPYVQYTSLEPGPVVDWLRPVDEFLERFTFGILIGDGD